jgi:hypothetical protein
MMRLPRDGIREEDPRLAEADRWDTLVRRIMGAADPELARLRARRTLGGQVGEWTRPLLPHAVGSLLAWVGTEEVDQTSDTPLMAEVLLPSPLVFWVGAGARLTLDEIVEALEAGTR